MVVSVKEEEERKRGGWGVLHTQREDRKMMGEKYLQQCQYFKVEKSKLPMVSTNIRLITTNLHLHHLLPLPRHLYGVWMFEKQTRG